MKVLPRAFPAVRAVRALGLAAVILCGLAAPASSQPTRAPTPPRWVLTTWPGKAVLAQTRFDGDQKVLMRSIECLRGDALLKRRIFLANGPAPKGARKCGVGCRAQLDIRDVPGLIIPGRFVEAQIGWRAARRDLMSQQDAIIEADPWTAKDASPEKLLNELAAICHLKTDSLTDASKWLVFSLEEFVASASARAQGFPLIYALGDGPANVLPMANLTLSPTTQGRVLRIDAEANVGTTVFSVVVDGGAPAHATMRFSEGRRSLFFNLPDGARSARISARALGEAHDVAVHLIAVATPSGLTAEDMIDIGAAQRAQP